METQQRLSRQDWLTAAMKVLAKEGHKALRPERLARRLGVSRGSFYWHFADVQDFHRAVLGQWEVVAVDSPYSDATMTTSDDPSDALRKLIGSAFFAQPAIEREVHSWASVSPLAAETVAKVNARRISLLSGLLARLRNSPDQAHAQAVILYWAYIGHVATGDLKTDEPIIAELFDWLC